MESKTKAILVKHHTMPKMKKKNSYQKKNIEAKLKRSTMRWVNEMSCLLMRSHFMVYFIFYIIRQNGRNFAGLVLCCIRITGMSGCDILYLYYCNWLRSQYMLHFYHETHTILRNENWSTSIFQKQQISKLMINSDVG